MTIPEDVLSPQPRPPEKSNTCLILGLVFGGFGGFVLICGGCCIGTMFFGLSEVTRQTRANLAENKVIREHIGEIQSFEIDWMASMQRQSAGQEDTFVFQTIGEKGKGTVEAVVLQAGDDFYVESGTLTMENGDQFDLVEGTESDEAEAAAADAEKAAREAAETLNAATEQDDKFAAKVQSALGGNAVLTERIGDIESFAYDIVQSTDEPGENVYVFQVAGSKGRGKLRAECITETPDNESVASAELILDNGERMQLFPEKPLE